VSPHSFDAVTGLYGDRFDPEVFAATAAHWAPRVAAQQDAEVPYIADVAYGKDDRHQMDLFPVKGRGAPVVLFVHGGGFIGGDKQVAPPFYANVGRYFAAHGMLGACMNYRRAPAGGWPAAAHDVDAAVEWLLERCDLYGGDPARLAVIGQSAGACHVATWLFHDEFAGGVRERVRAAVMMSGFYEAVAPLSAGAASYFGTDAALYPQRSPITLARNLNHPVLLTLAQHDPVPIRQHTLDLAARFASVGAHVQVDDLAGHNHVSPLMSVGSDEDSIGLMLRRFVSRCTARPAVTA
jgi:acetyl esterase/lipase